MIRPTSRRPDRCQCERAPRPKPHLLKLISSWPETRRTPHGTKPTMSRLRSRTKERVAWVRRRRAAALAAAVAAVCVVCVAAVFAGATALWLR